MLSPVGCAARLVLAALACLSLVASSAAFLQVHDAKHWFAFGDSWTADGFNATRGFDAARQPLRTMSGGKTWLDEITMSSTFPNLKSAHYNFALSGATASPDVLAVGYPNVSFSDQVGWFLGNFTDQKRADKREWEGSSSIFSVFFGINDVNVHTGWGYPIVDVLEPTFEAYDQSISRLYEAGARNFLLMNVPFFDRSPVSELVLAADPSRLPLNDSIRAWNERLAEYAAEMPGKYPEARVELYDVATWLDETLDRVEASGGLVADTWCAAYEPVSWQTWPDVPNDYEDSSCPVPLKQYAFIDGSHPTWSLQRLLAFDIVRTLSTAQHSHNFRRRSGHLLPVLEGKRHLVAVGRRALHVHRTGRTRGGKTMRMRERSVPKGILFG
ncbi:hypothetical protein JCM3775_006615 [Rhodotorula graminis]